MMQNVEVWVIAGLQAATLVALLAVILFRRYLFSYAGEKGKNLATKEDIGAITHQIEDAKSEYARELERVKKELELAYLKDQVLMQERVATFKEFQECLVFFKRYCFAAVGTYGDKGEFHPRIDGLPEEIPRAALSHVTKLYELEESQGIFLSLQAKESLARLRNVLSPMLSMEKKRFSESLDPKVYSNAWKELDNCLQELYFDLWGGGADGAGG